MRYTSPLGLIVFLLLLQPMLARADKAMPDATLKGHTSAVIAMAFSPDGTRLASVGDDGLLKLWDVAAKKEIFSVAGAHNNQNVVRFSPDGQNVITLGSESNLLVVDTKTGKPRPPIAINISGGPTAVDVSPDGKTLAVVGRGTLQFYDLASGAQKASYEVHKQYGVSAVAYSRDGARVATTGTDHNALVIDVAAGKIISTLNLELNGESVVFSQDGKTLYTNGSDRIIRSFDIATGQSQKLLEKGIPFLTFDLSRDGKLLILGGTGRSPWLYSVAENKLLEDAYDSEDRTRSGAISPDGNWLAGGGNEGEIFLWKVTH